MEYRIVEKTAFRVVGVRTHISANIDENQKIVTPFWEKTINAGLTKQIAELIDKEPFGLLAVSTADESGKGGYYYICAATYKPLPNGMFEVNIPNYSWAFFLEAGIRQV